jgi:transcriptional regulator with XRE-family HTH domain
VSVDLRLLAMLPSDEELARRQRRTAWWLHAVRRVRRKTLKEVADYLGLKASASVGDFERGETVPSLRQLTLLAAVYEVPLELFTNPPLTDEERISELPRAAAELEREDWEAQQAGHRGAEGEPPAARRRAS